MKLRQLSSQEWDARAASSPFASAFHGAWWLDLTVKCLGGAWQPWLLEDGSSEYLLPLLQGSPWSSEGFRLGGIGYGGPIPMADDRRLFAPGYLQAAMKAIETLQGKPCTALTTFPHELWSESESLQVQHTRILPSGGKTPETIFQKHFSVSVRTAIRKAERSGIRVERLEPTQIEKAHQLLKETQLRVGAAYTTPFELFSAICSRPTENLVLGAEHEGKLIATAVFLLHPNQCTYLFNGWDRSARELNANYALVWQGILLACERSCRSFNFGESHTSEIDRSKSKWGAERVPVIRHKF